MVTDKGPSYVCEYCYYPADVSLCIVWDEEQHLCGLYKSVKAR